MVKGKVYTIMGIDGIQLSRSKGISILTNGVNANVSKVSADIFERVSESPAFFMEHGTDVIAEVGIENNAFIVDRVVDFGVEGAFEDLFDDEEDDEEEDA